MTNWRILIVDDDREMRNSLVDLTEAAGWQAKDLARANEVERWIGQFRPDVILSDVRMPGMSGIELLECLPVSAPPLVLISAHGDIGMAVEAMSNGAYSFVEKPYDPRRLLSILSHAADQHRLRETNARLLNRLKQLSGLDRTLLGQTPEIQTIRDDIAGLGDSAASVLVQGETGTGKELVARALHNLGQTGNGPFIAVNAATLTQDRLEKIAPNAQGGALFLDEITACPADVQAMLLRLIDAKEIANPDTGAPQKVDLRVLSATNEDIEQAVSSGRFRQDLFFRLNTASIKLPPLRARRDDIPLLVTHFMTELAQTYEITPPDLTPEDLASLLAHDWPGNVRELRNVVERRILQARRGAGSIAQAISPQDEFGEIPHTLREAVAAFEREMIGKAIQAHEGRMDAVAETLGIGRRTLNEKIVKLGLDKDALL